MTDTLPRHSLIGVGCHLVCQSWQTAPSPNLKIWTVCVWKCVRVWQRAVEVAATQYCWLIYHITWLWLKHQTHLLQVCTTTSTSSSSFPVKMNPFHVPKTLFLHPHVSHLTPLASVALSLSRCGADGHRLAHRKLLLCGWRGRQDLRVWQGRADMCHTARPGAVQP